MLDIPEEKQIIINAIRAKNNVCITGAAGTGKSFLLRLIKEHFPFIHITASTGVAAVNVSGTTIHSWSGIGKAHLPATEIARFINSGPGTRLRRQIKKAKLLAIDEISMISAQVLDLLDQVLKLVRENQKPFGGIQLVVLGDFFQLPPINKEGEMNFCFEANSWQEGNFHIFELKEIFRQQDLMFVELLNNVRHANIAEADLKILSERQAKAIPENIQPTMLVTHNYQAEKINLAKLAALPTKESVTYSMSEAGNENTVEFLKKNCLAQPELTLKQGAQVMMLKNSMQKQGIINGSIGVIIGFSKNDFPIVKFFNGEVCIIGPEEWTVEIFNETTQTKEVVAAIEQIPLALAWAITIHKSQGMTLDHVLCDLTHSFAEGQIYVALSRVKTLDGLYIRGFRPDLLKINSKVKEFYDTLDQIEKYVK